MGRWRPGTHAASSEPFEQAWSRRARLRDADGRLQRRGQQVADGRALPRAQRQAEALAGARDGFQRLLHQRGRAAAARPAAGGRRGAQLRVHLRQQRRQQRRHRVQLLRRRQVVAAQQQPGRLERVQAVIGGRGDAGRAARGREQPRQAGAAGRESLGRGLRHDAAQVRLQAGQHVWEQRPQLRPQRLDQAREQVACARRHALVGVAHAAVAQEERQHARQARRLLLQHPAPARAGVMRGSPRLGSAEARSAAQLPVRARRVRQSAARQGGAVRGAHRV